MLVYVWSRRNPYIRMNFFGLLNFQAPYLPWVLLGFSLMLGNAVVVDLMGKTCLFTHIDLFNRHLIDQIFISSTVGIAVGHVYYFLEDVFPDQPGGFKMLRTPSIL